GRHLATTKSSSLCTTHTDGGASSACASAHQSDVKHAVPPPLMDQHILARHLGRPPSNTARHRLARRLKDSAQIAPCPFAHHVSIVRRCAQAHGLGGSSVRVAHALRQRLEHI